MHALQRSLHMVSIRAAKRQFLTASEHYDKFSVAARLHFSDMIDADDQRAMDTYKLHRR